MKSSAIRLLLTIILALVPTLASAYYDPVQGRWCSRDPIGEQGGVKLYGFVGNRPVSLIDPFGLEAVVPVFARSDSLNQTGVEASQRALAETRKEKESAKQIEHCGSICCRTEGGRSVFFATGPVQGTKQSCNFRKAPCPNDSNHRGWYHSHPDQDSAKYGENDFSYDDWGNVNNDEAAFLGEQSGVRKMTSERRKDRNGVETNLPKLVRIVDGKEIPYEPWNNWIRAPLGLPKHPDPRNMTGTPPEYQ